MNPGRELDLLIARKVMGVQLRPPKSYSTNISMAWTIVEKLRDTWVMTLEDKTAVWFVTFIDDRFSEIQPIATGFGLTPAHAICEAALQTVGK